MWHPERGSKFREIDNINLKNFSMKNNFIGIILAAGRGSRMLKDKIKAKMYDRNSQK